MSVNDSKETTRGGGAEMAEMTFNLEEGTFSKEGGYKRMEGSFDFVYKGLTMTLTCRIANSFTNNEVNKGMVMTLRLSTNLSEGQGVASRRLKCEFNKDINDMQDDQTTRRVRYMFHQQSGMQLHLNGKLRQIVKPESLMEVCESIAQEEAAIIRHHDTTNTINGTDFKIGDVWHDMNNMKRVITDILMDEQPPIVCVSLGAGSSERFLEFRGGNEFIDHGGPYPFTMMMTREKKEQQKGSGRKKT